MYDLAIDARGLSKRFGRVLAVDGVDLSVPRAAVFGILGPTGAGKTTLAQMVLGAVRPDSGQLSVLGGPASRPHIRTLAGFAPERAAFPSFLTGQAALVYGARGRCIPSSQMLRRVAEALDMVGLMDRGRERVSTYSGGMLRRLGLALAVLHEPELVLLDEPASALDPGGQAMARAVVERLRRRGATVVTLARQPSEVEAACDSVAVLSAGRIVQQGRVRDLLGSEQVVEVAVEAMNDAAMAAVRRISPKLRLQDMPPTRFTAHLPDPSAVPDLAAALVQNGVRLLALTTRRQTLQDLYLRALESPPPSP